MYFYFREGKEKLNNKSWAKSNTWKLSLKGCKLCREYVLSISSGAYKELRRTIYFS